MCTATTHEQTIPTNWGLRQEKRSHTFNYKKSILKILKFSNNGCTTSCCSFYFFKKSIAPNNLK